MLAEGSDRSQAARGRRSFASRLFGYDLFISFALGSPPRGSQSLASDLARRLRERDLTVFFSEDEAPPGSPLDATLRNALLRARVLVVLVNHETLRSPRWIRMEVEEFRRRRPGRPIIPVNIGAALQDAALAREAQAWLPFQGHIWVDADDAAAQAGQADDALVERLATAPRRVRSNVAWRRVVGGAMAALAALATALGVTAWVAIQQRNEAVAAQVIAQGAGTDGDLDTKLLANAEALRRYPDRVDARLQTLSQLVRAADHRALLRPGFEPGGWASTGDGRLLVLAGPEGEVALLSLDDWSALDLAPAAPRSLGNFPRLVLSDDGSVLMTDLDGTWTLRSIADKRLHGERSFRPPPELSKTTPMRLSPDKRQVLAEGWPGTWLWTIGSATATRLGEGANLCRSFSADGSEVLIADGGGVVRIRLVEGAPVRGPRVSIGRIHAGSKDCTRLAVSDEALADSPVFVHDGRDGARLTELQGTAGSGYPHAAFAPDGRSIVLAHEKLQRLGLWSTQSGERSWTSDLRERVLGEPFVSPEGTWVAVEVGDPPLSPRRLQVRDARTGEIVLDVPTNHPVDAVVFGKGEDAVLTLGPGGERRRSVLPVWALGDRNRLHEDGVRVQASAAEFSPSADVLLLTPKGGDGLEGRDPHTGERRSLPEDNRSTLQRLAEPRLGPGGHGARVMSPDGRALAVGDRKGVVALLDLRDGGGPGRVLHQHASPVTELAFDPYSEWIASAARDRGNVLVQRVDGTSPAAIVVRDAGQVVRLHFVDSARWLRVDDTVWDTERRLLLAQLAGGQTRLARAEVAPVGDAVAWLYKDGSLRLGRWNAPALVNEVCTLVVRNLSCEEWQRLYGPERYRRTCDARPAPSCTPGASQLPARLR